MGRFVDPGTDWLRRRNCKQSPPEIFNNNDNEVVRAAKVICRTCLVRNECLAYAITHRERAGVWGGMSEKDRRGIARDNALLGSIACADYISGKRYSSAPTSDTIEDLAEVNS
jgi:WhiB family redox-sensing transcriptional regulator